MIFYNSKYVVLSHFKKTFTALSGLALWVFSSSSVNAANHTDNLPPLQLAKSLDQDNLKIDLNGYWYTEKLDGIRGYWDGQRLLTRQGNLINAPIWFTQALPEFAVEGELWIGRQQFERVSGIVRQQQPDEDSWRDIHFYLFDLPHYPGTFNQRRVVLEQWVASINLPHLQVVAISAFASTDALQKQLSDWSEKGAEGIMLYRGDGLYHASRSDDLLKLKGYEDAEARVIGILPGKGKYQGMLGALLVETNEGVRFKVGSGFTDAERKTPPQIGTIITYRFNGKTRKGTPRFARFERLRTDE